MRTLLFATTLLASPALAEPCLDVELAFVADVSGSMSAPEKKMQREGYFNAFHSGDLIQAIAGSYCGAIAVTYIEFANEPVTLVDWQIIATDEDARAFGLAVRDTPNDKIATGITGIAKAIEHAAESMLNNGLEAERLVIDVSADGPDNVTLNVAEIRDKYANATEDNGWREITINGLPVLGGGAYYGLTPAEFQEYFADNVIGGPGAFMEPAKGVDDIGRALLRKIIREIG